MKIRVNNFGPISEGEIVLKPLTIFTGSNNSGKSYISTLIYSILNNFKESLLKVRNFLVNTHIGKLQYIIRDIEDGKVSEISGNFLNEFQKEVYKRFFEKNLEEQLKSYFNCQVKDLIKFKDSYCNLNINYRENEFSLQIKDNSLKLEKFPEIDSNLKFIIRFKKGNIDNFYIEKISDTEILLEFGKNWTNNTILYSLLSVIADTLIDKLLFKNQQIENVYYLPSFRSGVIYLYEKISRFDFIDKDRDIPKIVYDFLYPLLNYNIYKKTKNFAYDIAVEYEKEILNGQIGFGNLWKSIPDIVYNEQIPIYRLSSSILELTSLFIYLKYVIELPAILIIEEPEAHLHPLNQSKLAKLLVKLVRSGLYLIITTHSEYLLGQINNFISLSKIPENLRKEKYRSEDYLNIDEVSAYVFEYNEKSKGYIIKELEITEEDGFSEEEFIKVHEALYEETFKIHKDLEEIGNEKPYREEGVC